MLSCFLILEFSINKPIELHQVNLFCIATNPFLFQRLPDYKSKCLLSSGLFLCREKWLLPELYGSVLLLNQDKALIRFSFLLQQCLLLRFCYLMAAYIFVLIIDGEEGTDRFDNENRLLDIGIWIAEIGIGVKGIKYFPT